MLFSVTFRPTDDADLNTVAEFLSKSISYYIGFECGSSSTVNHLQCHIDDKSGATNNFRKKIIKGCPTVEFTPVNLVIKTITQDADYHLGYCQKEGVRHLTNIGQEFLERCRLAYERGKETSKKIKKGTRCEDIVKNFVESIGPENMYSRQKLQDYLCDLYLEGKMTYADYTKLRIDALSDFCQMIYQRKMVKAYAS